MKRTIPNKNQRQFNTKKPNPHPYWVEKKIWKKIGIAFLAFFGQTYFYLKPLWMLFDFSWWRKKYSQFRFQLTQHNKDNSRLNAFWYRFNHPFVRTSGVSILGLILAAVLTVFAFILTSKNVPPILQFGQELAFIALITFGSLAVISNSDKSIDPEDFISALTFLSHGLLISPLAKAAFAMTSSQFFFGLFVFSLATTFIMIIILTGYYFLSLFFKLAGI
ncbi:MAG TPA: hypothetical protein PK530_09035 [Anaerolineales bacterium]|nr:hypothetical protein [Anaerolineales bacterium]